MVLFLANTYAANANWAPAILRSLLGKGKVAFAVEWLWPDSFPVTIICPALFK